MSSRLSPRLLEIIEALPLRRGLRVLEVGCGPAAMAREISARIGDGHILAIDRSERAIRQASMGSKKEIASGRMSLRQVAIEHFELLPGEKQFDLAVAIRVGALDGRHPEIEQQSLKNLAKAVKPGGSLFIDGGNPLIEVILHSELPQD